MAQRFMPLLAAALLSAIAATLLSTVLAVVDIEEPWNIAVASEVLTVARVTFSVALAHALVLGLPLFLLLRSTGRVGIASCSLAGFLVGAAPFAVLALISMFGLQSASSGGKATVVNGIPTFAGWMEYAQAVGFAGLLGLAGGLTFWLAVLVSGQIAGEPKGSEAPSELSAGSWSIVTIATLFTCTVFLLPRVVRDNSCHNLFRDGRTSIAPQIDANIKLTAEDWPKLTQIFKGFAVMHALSFRGDQQIRSGRIMWRDLNLCSDAGINIDALDRPWLAEIKSPLANRGIQFSVYELKAGSGWNPLARDLVKQIDIAWPDKTTFRGPDGKVMAMSEALRGREPPPPLGR